jgi:hypothetical protein
LTQEVSRLQEAELAQRNPQIEALQVTYRRQAKAVEDISTERDTLGDSPMDTYEIEQTISDLGYNIADVLSARIGGGVPYFSPFAKLREVAAGLGLWTVGGLGKDTARLWLTLLNRLFDRRVKSVQVTADGRLQMDGKRTDCWEDLTRAERAFCIDTFCLTLLLRCIGRLKPSPMPFTLRFDPYGGLSDVETSRLNALYRKMSSHLQIVVIRAVDDLF